MLILWGTLLLVFALVGLARFYGSYVPYSLNGYRSDPIRYLPQKWLTLLAAAVLVAVAGLRSNIGDTVFYIYAYETNTYDWQRVWQEKDIGFGLLQMLLQQLSPDPQVLLFVTALATNVLIVLILYHRARLLEISLFVYIASGAYIVSMNGIRQYLAAGIAFAATSALLAGRWKTYAAVVLIASLFHQSALILLPLYPLVRRPAWSRSSVLGLLAALLFALGFGTFSNLFFAAISSTQYGEYVSFAEGGASWIRVLVQAAPLMVAYIGRERLRMICPSADVIVNMSLVALLFYIISTQNWIFARLGIYFGLYQLILISWLTVLFRKREQKLIYYAILVFYALFFFYENQIVLRLIYESNLLTWG